MAEAPASIFARRLRQERQAAGLTQTELARRMAERMPGGMYGSTLTRIEKLERLVKLDEAVCIAEVLGMPLAALVSEKVDELEAQIREAQLEVANAEAALQLAVNEAAARQEALDVARQQLEELQEQEGSQLDAEVRQELAEDLRSAQRPADS